MTLLSYNDKNQLEKPLTHKESGLRNLDNETHVSYQEISPISAIISLNNCTGIHNLELKDTLADLSMKSNIIRSGQLDVKDFTQAQLTDKFIQPIYEKVKEKPESHKNYKIQDNVLLKKTPNGFLPMLPSALEALLFNCKHYHVLSGHMSANAIIKEVQKEFFVPDIKRKVKSFVRHCVICPMAKSLNMRKHLQGTTLQATRPRQYMSFDIFSGLPQDGTDNKYVLTFVDNFSLFVICIVTNSKDMQTLHAAFLQVFAIWSCIPEIVFSDEETALTLADSQDFFNSLQIHHNMGAAHSHWRLLSEVAAVQKIKKFLRSTLFANSNLAWSDALYFATIAANNTPTAYKYSPYELFYGQKSVTNKLIQQTEQVENIEEYMDKLTSKYNNMIREVNQLRQESKEKRAKLINEHRQSKEFPINSLVWLKGLTISPHKAIKVQNKGPYKVIEKIGTHNYKLASLSQPQKCHVISHSSFLENYRNNVDLSPINFPRISLK